MFNLLRDFFVSIDNSGSASILVLKTIRFLLSFR